MCAFDFMTFAFFLLLNVNILANIFGRSAVLAKKKKESFCIMRLENKVFLARKGKIQRHSDEKLIH